MTLPSSESMISVESSMSSLKIPPVTMILLVLGIKAHLSPALLLINFVGSSVKVWLLMLNLKILFEVHLPPISHISCFDLTAMAKPRVNLSGIGFFPLYHISEFLKVVLPILCPYHRVLVGHLTPQMSRRT